MGYIAKAGPIGMFSDTSALRSNIIFDKRLYSKCEASIDEARLDVSVDNIGLFILSISRDILGSPTR